MPEYEGWVTAVRADGGVDVMIAPTNPGIVGAPRLNVCHGATGSSRITVRAENPIDAKVGDAVSILCRGGDLVRNWAVLLGIPLAGVAGGLAVGAVLSLFLGLGWETWVSLAVVGLATAAVIAHRIYGRVQPHPMVLTTVLQRGALPGGTLCGLPERSRDGVEACRSCTKGL